MTSSTTFSWPHIIANLKHFLSFMSFFLTADHVTGQNLDGARQNHSKSPLTGK